MELLTGFGLATAAGLNAYIPMLLMGLMGRFTGLVHLPPGDGKVRYGLQLAVEFDHAIEKNRKAGILRIQVGKLRIE